MLKKPKNYFIYILICRGNRFYIGYTTDITRRYQEHCEGSTKSKFTRSFPPEKLAACWAIENDLNLALSLERRLKQLSKPQKQSLIQSPASLIHHWLPKWSIDNETQQKISVVIAPSIVQN